MRVAAGGVLTCGASVAIILERAGDKARTATFPQAWSLREGGTCPLRSRGLQLVRKSPPAGS